MLQEADMSLVYCLLKQPSLIFLLAGNNALNIDGTIAQRGWGNVVKIVVTTLIKLFSFIRLFISGAERRLENVHHSAPPVIPAPEKPRPRTVSDEEMHTCLQRLDNLESLCNQLATRPPQIPEDKELMLLSSFERIKSVEADLERTKRVSSYNVLLKSWLFCVEYRSVFMFIYSASLELFHCLACSQPGLSCRYICS